MDALGINLGYLIMQILIITILLLVMRGLVYKPILLSWMSAKRALPRDWKMHGRRRSPGTTLMLKRKRS
jgi:hypothetical protein